jgi:hypothetical protein
MSGCHVPDHLCPHGVPLDTNSCMFCNPNLVKIFYGENQKLPEMPNEIENQLQTDK